MHPMAVGGFSGAGGANDELGLRERGVSGVGILGGGVRRERGDGYTCANGMSEYLSVCDNRYMV